MSIVQTIQGTITEVMESWPLQLVVQFGKDIVHLALTLDTTITRNGLPVKPNELRVSQLVRLEGIASGPDSFTVSWIEILENGG